MGIQYAIASISTV